MIERVVDYLQASVLLSEATIIMKGFKPVPPIRFYKRGYLHPMGFRLYFGNPNSDKAMAVAAGDAMQSLRNDGKLDAEIIDWFLSSGAEISRLDLAVTDWIDDEFLTMEDVICWYESGLVESSLTGGGGKIIQSTNLGSERALETFYIGDISKRGKRGIFRAYDKGIELGLGQYLSTRLELELKREKADKVAKRLAASNDIAGNFRAYFNVKADNFNRLMDADAVTTHRGKNQVKEAENEEIERRWQWLLSQVAPALKNALEEERKAGRGDVRLTQFMSRSGLLQDARNIAQSLADMKYRDKLERNELIPRKSGESD